MFIIFYGPEGSGKSTQAKMLAKELKLLYLGSGDLVRKYAQQDNGIMGEICRQALAIGHYVADSEMFVLWKNRLKQTDTKKGWVLDGFPRNISQAHFLDEKLNKYQQRISFVFYLKVGKKESVRRLLKRGRRNPNGELHDSIEKIQERLKLYAKGEAGVLRIYKEAGVLRVIDGEQTIEKINKDILKEIKK